MQAKNDWNMQVPIEFVYEKIREYLFLDKLYRIYQSYRNSSSTPASCKTFTPTAQGMSDLVQ